jgi:hypothetical protein
VRVGPFFVDTGSGNVIVIDTRSRSPADAEMLNLNKSIETMHGSVDEGYDDQ